MLLGMDDPLAVAALLDHLTPFGAAGRSGAQDVAAWLRDPGQTAGSPR